MRPITKFLLLLVAAFIVYLVWPRTPDLKNFNPEEMAKLEVESWQAQRENQGMAGLIARFKIYTSQYHFSPMGAFRMAQTQDAAMKDVKRAHEDQSDEKAQDRALIALTEKYAMMKREAKEPTDPAGLAGDEVAWSMLVLAGAPTAQVAEPMTRMLAARYGGVPGDFVDTAANLAYAQGMVFTNQAQDAQSGMSAVDYAREGYKLLKEIAAVPVVPPEPDAAQ